MLLAPRLPFLATLSFGQRLMAASIMGVVFSTLSPSVTLGILSETASAGPISETVLGVVVLADIVIVVLFALVNSAARMVFGGDGGDESLGPAMGVLIEVFGSMLVGV